MKDRIRTNEYSKEKVNYILEQYNMGRTQKDIAEELGTYNTTISRILKRNNITTRTTASELSIVKTNPFDNDDKDYWIGMLAADGCITRNNSRIVLELQERDLEVMKQYKAFLRHDVSINTTKHYSGKVLYRVSFSNPDAVKFLNSIGITPRKSFSLKLDCSINKDIFRGILDGDGYIVKVAENRPRIGICSASKKFIYQIEDYLKSLNFNPTITVDTRNNDAPLYAVNMYRFKELEQLYDIIYKDAKYYMSRKYLKFGSLLGKLND
jgi:intein/homing endonuclease